MQRMICNTPGVAGAVLQTPWWLIHWFIISQSIYVKISSRHLYTQTVRATNLKFWHNASCVSCDTCHVSCVTRHMSCVRCQVFPVTSNSQTVRARELKFLGKVYLLPPVTGHMSNVTSHRSLVICYFFDIFMKLFVKGLLSMGPNSSSLILVLK